MATKKENIDDQIRREAGLEGSDWHVMEDVEPIQPSRTAPAGAPPQAPGLKPFFDGTISSDLQHDANYFKQQYQVQGIPVLPLMPLNSSGKPAVNSSTQSATQNPIAAAADTGIVALNKALPGVVRGIGPSAVVVQASLANVTDSGNRFAQTGSGLSYRPTSNPLSAQDHSAGSPPSSASSITIAPFTMRTSSKGDISVSGGSIGLLSISTLYYVYYDDPNLAGGAVTFHASTTKTDAINGSGRFFVGSILTPAANAPDTSGNNDGGTGAQGGNIFILSMSTVTSAGISGNAVLTNPNNALDGDQTTFAKLTLTGDGSHNAVGNWKLGGPPGVSASYSSATLNARYAIPTNSLSPFGAGQGVANITYSNITATVSGTLVAAPPGTTAAEQVVSAALPLGLNLSQLVVTIGINSFNGITDATSGSLEFDIYEIWITAVQ
jgi:hypothetical protein